MDDTEDYYYNLYEDETGRNLGDIYLLRRSPGLRTGNRRWGDNGYVRAGRQEARPIVRSTSAGSSQQNKQTTSKEVVGRRAKRALKREAIDKAAVVKHLARFFRK
ncbi:uncharacterized protein LOC127253583 [Andrographis paniculata]|uniref:uncharacterized protein LOC127253583 n=1 Tax=Andrographis paniculata TaxID=175694 RepID=UPI0021E892BB|nr:uncharacterized protein LOC127253583 [Andrographis paniculata]